ncbi:MAG: NAD(P)/FAD-dependent oxidoreductase [Haliscomenobacteraceae bacterium CHB4]|nr:NADH dehydrogenase-like protein [Saprospiraceae bacterium]MCE7923442.1 NAD(P)/FAD-dependent oxidoreductase [Haliscomenobacteraceae bacterium CHB4]
MQFNIPDTGQKRIVIVGGGFGGLTLARKLSRSDFQVVLIDKNNYHQFQPLFYQVAMAGLEPSSIVFPFRKVFQKSKNVFVRVTKVLSVHPKENKITTTIGTLRYDYLVLAIGADTNWYGKERVRAHAIPMKSVSEALYLRNLIFEDYERAVTSEGYEQRQRYLDIVIVGGGPTGVEVAGSLAEMKRHIIAKDYNDLDSGEIDIHLVHGDKRLLNTMSEQASAKAETYLRELGVQLWLDKVVTDFDGEKVTINDGTVIRADKVIWAAGVTGNTIEGLPAEALTKGNRLKVNEINQVAGAQNIFAIGDIAYQTEEKWPGGHPQVAQVAIQQGALLTKNLLRLSKGKTPLPFRYRDLGSMATVGRHRAVVDLPFWRFQGAFAWFVWLFVHLFSILGMKNKLFIFLNWVWNYATYDQSLRLVIKPWRRDKTRAEVEVGAGGWREV